MKRLLVTGRHGFVGGIVARALAAGGIGENWILTDLPGDFDLRDMAATMALVRQAKPDAVLHLAAQSWVPESFRDPEATLQINLVGTLHLLQSLSAAGFRGRLVYVGTGEVYGRVPEVELPIAETRSPRPRNPYAVSKLAAEALCWQWHASEGMDVVLARPFNHIGPGQSDRFAIAGFARQIAEIRHGNKPPVIQVGDIETTRDFTDVHDVVDAYFALLERGETGEVYNVCSGIERTIASMLNKMVELAGVDVRIEQDSVRLRQTEQRRVCGDPSKIQRQAGWTPTTPIEVSLRATLDYWDERIANG